MFSFFKRKGISDIELFKKLGGLAYIRNGVGYGFVSSKELYDNCHLEIGIGRVTSGYGDWGGGFDRVSDSPLKIVIDKDYNIISKDTDSFYNSESSQKTEKIAMSLKNKLGKKFIVKNPLLKECIDKVFSVIPYKSHIGLDVDLKDEERTRNMLNYFTDLR